MEQYIMKGGNPLVGEVTVSGAKNAALGILTAAIMTDEDVLIENLPDVRDINVMLEAIEEIGAKVERVDRHTVQINASSIQEISVDDEYIRRIRASYISSEPFWENIKRQVPSREAAISAAVPLIST